ncbi:pilus assembly PilX family protein [Burkholderia multivorans]|uniref:PilX/PilW C-terminal domain-containing protein n=1 Tax=Burkholderia multivorans TaxID=87883 RepID=A0A2S9MX19_9BURK|nr:hypothetical protein [Burkholderia multivorans]MBU9143801.1 hypothetical protein [Burkholderia multivorans]MBU9516539.1 hypothetical protein [Burkholderia multivorans]MBU9525341.1 hypothetical protein [Burkholderia multivorans]MBU9536898.1 hypothetical protein [Burkholderia multivorans]MBU9638459.1 hypothetical protein [Burkholderia multivorans]
MAVSAAVAASTAIWFESALTESRRTRALSDRLIAFHAADAALGACTAALLRGTARDSSAREPQSELQGELQGELPGQPQREPTMWQRMPALAHPDAFQPFADWPMAAQPPRCLIEAWPDADPPDGRAYLITARGVGAQASSAVWLQTQIAVRGGRVVAQRWRRVAALHR